MTGSRAAISTAIGTPPLFCGSVALYVHAQSSGLVYPGATWEGVDPQDAGWSSQELEVARQYLQTVPAGSVMVVDRGRVVAEWGDPAKRVKL